MKVSQQLLMALVVLSASTTVYAGCATREKDDTASDLYKDIKCGLSSASDKLKDGVSTVGSSLKDGTNKAFDAVSKAVIQTGTALRDGLIVAVENGFDLIRGITGRKMPDTSNGEGVIDVRMSNFTEP